MAEEGPMSLWHIHEPSPGVRVVRVGPIRRDTPDRREVVGELWDFATAGLGPGDVLVLDFRGLTVLASEFLARMLRAQADLSKQGAACIAFGMEDRVLEILRLLDLYRHLNPDRMPIVETEAEALELARRHQGS
jgi:hypothetical protein